MIVLFRATVERIFSQSRKGYWEFELHTLSLVSVCPAPLSILRIFIVSQSLRVASEVIPCNTDGMILEVKENEVLAPHTVYKIGGPARFFVEAKNADDVRTAFLYAVKRGLPFFILGAGSNILVSDKGFDGLVIKMTSGEVRVDGERLIADGGIMMARVAGEATRAGLAGFEWGIGIPGTVGGSVRGNAGCFGGEMKGVIESAHIFNIRKSDFRILKNVECEFAYRDSIFKRRPEWVILSATFKLKKDVPGAIQERIKYITAERTGKQDIGTKSCGCIFKNVSWDRIDHDRKFLLARHDVLTKFKDNATVPAAFLIDECSLKGTRIGRVYVSRKHANFFVNEGGAAAREVVMLVSLVKNVVRKKFGIMLEEEIQYVGF